MSRDAAKVDLSLMEADAEDSEKDRCGRGRSAVRTKSLTYRSGLMERRGDLSSIADPGVVDESERSHILPRYAY